MAIADRIAAAQADIEEFNGILNERNIALEQVDTANLQHQNDQQRIIDDAKAIKSLEDEVVSAKMDIASLTEQVAEDVKERQTTELLVSGLRSQLASLQSVKVYDGLEFLPWALNTKAEVGGSGLGTGGSKLPGIELAELWVNPDPPIAPKVTNYFDGYFPQDFTPLDDSITRWRVENTFIFPTQADIDACNCLEMETRQVLKDGTMFVAGVQLNYGSNTLRYWDHVKKWTASGQPCAKPKPLVPFTVVVVGHRDAANIYHDFISNGGVRVDLAGTQYAAWKESPIWRQMLRCALQIDSKESATPTMCRVKIGNTKFTVSQ